MKKQYQNDRNLVFRIIISNADIITLIRILIISLLVISSNIAKAQHVYYVSTNGNDSNDGLSELKPWKTLAYAESQATTAGDIIAPKKGDIWLITATLQVNSSGSSGKPIIWDGSLWGTGSNAIIRKNQALVNNAAVHIASCDYVIFQNITVDGNNYGGDGIVVGGWLPVYGTMDQNDEDSIVVQNCNITNIGDASAYSIALLVRPTNNDMFNINVNHNTIDGSNNEGIAVYPTRVSMGGISGSGTHNSYIGYNVVTNCGKKGDGVGAGIMVVMNQDAAIVEYNVITQGVYGHTPGIAIGRDPEDPDQVPKGLIVRYNNVESDERFAMLIQQGGAINADIYYNLFHSNGSTATVFIQSASYTDAELNFYNNVIISEGNAGVGFKNDGGPAGIIDFRNNIVVNEGNASPGGYYCIATSVSSAITHSNNCYYKTLAGDNVYFALEVSSIYARTTIETWEATCVKTDPLFVDLEGFNFHIQSGSPLIGKGVTIPRITTDFDGIPVSDPPNIGAFQGDGSSSNLAPGSIGTAQSICYNTVPAPLIQITAPSGGTGTYTYQWQSSPNNSTWTNINGATLSGYSPPTLLASTYYRRSITSDYNTVNSTSILITVSTQITSAQLHDDILIGSNTSTNFNIDISGGTSPYTVNYTRNGAARPTINNYTSGIGISTGVLTTGVYIYALTSVTDVIGCAAQNLGSNITVTVTENGNLAPGSIGTEQSVCYNKDPAPLTQITSPSGGTGTYTYQWQSSINNSLWTNISGATLSGYSPPALSVSTYFRYTVTSGTFIPVNSSSILITILPQVTSAELHDDITIVDNTSTNLNITLTGGTSPFTVDYTLNGVSQSTINNYSSGTNISTGVLTTGAYKYALASVTDANGCEAQSLGTEITVTVTGLISGVPNVFTPNDDGINETWDIPSIQNFPDAVIRIYDRNLKQIIEYTGLDSDWDGRDSNGTPLPSGAYLYIIDLNNGTRPTKGYISLVR
jgi:gliding motility-associated-like protein